MSVQDHPKLAALEAKFSVKNIGQSKLSIHPNNPRAAEPLVLKPGEETKISAFQLTTIYKLGLDAFLSSQPAKIEVVPLQSSEPAPKVEEPVEDEFEAQQKAVEEDEPQMSDEEKEAAVVRMKDQIKTLEAEYKTKGTSGDRKQEIKEEIRELRVALKSLK